jgi:hypothetical protein
MQPRFDRSLASAWLVCTGVAIAVMLWPSCTQIASTAAADDPFAVLAAKPVQVRPQSEREVRIVRPDGTPAADALVVLVRGQRGADLGPDWRAAAMRWPSDEPRQYAAMARDGERLAVDERGCVRTPHHGFVYAFAGDCVGRLFVEDTVATVQLVATHPCTVEVVDAQGQPTARVPIAVRTTGLGLLLSQHTTGADGTRTLRLLVSRPDECRIGLYIGTNAPIDAPLPPRGGHVRLAMPPTTAVTATYVGDLTPRRALSFRLQCKSPEQAIPGEPVGERSAVWPFVAIGTEVTATVDLRAPEPLGTVASARAATTVTANAPPLELGATFTSASVVLQVLDLAGQPTPHRAFTLRIQQGDARRLRHIRADPEGWVELSLPGGFDDVQPVTFHGTPIAGPQGRPCAAEAAPARARPPAPRSDPLPADAGAGGRATGPSRRHGTRGPHHIDHRRRPPSAHRRSRSLRAARGGVRCRPRVRATLASRRRGDPTQDARFAVHHDRRRDRAHVVLPRRLRSASATPARRHRPSPRRAALRRRAAAPRARDARPDDAGVLGRGKARQR